MRAIRDIGAPSDATSVHAAQLRGNFVLVGFEAFAIALIVGHDLIETILGTLYERTNPNAHSGVEPVPKPRPLPAERLKVDINAIHLTNYLLALRDQTEQGFSGTFIDQLGLVLAKRAEAIHELDLLFKQ